MLCAYLAVGVRCARRLPILFFIGGGFAYIFIEVEAACQTFVALTVQIGYQSLHTFICGIDIRKIKDS
jgi:hypothetical protein